MNLQVMEFYEVVVESVILKSRCCVVEVLFGCEVNNVLT